MGTIASQSDRRFGNTRLVEELDDERQIDVEAKQVRGVHLAALAEAGDAAEHYDALHPPLVVQNVQHLLHEGLASPMLGFSEVDARRADVDLFACGQRRLAQPSGPPCDNPPAIPHGT